MKSKKLKKKKALKRTKKVIRKKVTKKAVKKKAAKRVSKKVFRKAKPAKPETAKSPTAGLQELGIVVHYFPQVKAGVIKITNGRLSIGEMLYIKGHTTDLKQPVNSMQIDHVAVNQATRGQEIGLLVKARVRVNDVVYKL